jgi:hypothetical protein
MIDALDALDADAMTETSDFPERISTPLKYVSHHTDKLMQTVVLMFLLSPGSRTNQNLTRGMDYYILMLRLLSRITCFFQVSCLRPKNPINSLSKISRRKVIGLL